MSKKKKILLVISGILVVLAAVFVVSWLIWQHDKGEGEKENQKYGLETSVENVTSTGMTMIVECQKTNNSLHINNSPCLVEKATIFGWKELERLEESYATHAVYYGIRRKTTHDFSIDWKSLYGELSKGTYRARIPIHSDDDKIVGWCYATFEILEKSKQEERQQQKAINDNYDKWKKIYNMTYAIDELYVQAENWREVDVLKWWQEYKPYDSDFDSMEPKVGYSSFFRLYYGSLISDLAITDSLPESNQEKGFQIFGDMNTELHDISAYVIDEIENGKDPAELMKEDSELYQKVSKELNTFSRKYIEPIRALYQAVNVSNSVF